MGELLTDPGAQVHAQKVSQEAQKAIGFLNECFTNRTPNVKAVTAKGSIMDSMAFKSEAGYDKLVRQTPQALIVVLLRDFVAGRLVIEL